MGGRGLEQGLESLENRADRRQSGAESGALAARDVPIGPSLAAVIEAWPKLHEAIKADILTMAKLLCQVGYPRRGTHEETQTIYDYAQKVQSLIPHADAVELG